MSGWKKQQIYPELNNSDDADLAINFIHFFERNHSTCSMLGHYLISTKQCDTWSVL